MRLIIAGSRGFDNYDILTKYTDQFIERWANDEDVTIISGTARGADQLGERYADDHDYRVERHPAQWDTWGRSAGYRRNEHMAKIATHLIVFWDGKSRGTKHMVDIGQRYGLKTEIVMFSPETV